MLHRSFALTALLVLAISNFVQARSPLPPIPQPQIPEKTFTITDHGAVADGKTLCTDAITKAINACKDAGGGIVIVPAGTFLTGPFDFVSKMNLRLDEGATLLFTDDPSAFSIDDNRHRVSIGGKNLTDIALTGAGIIDGQGAKWWAEFLKVKGKPEEKKTTRRPNLVDFTTCQRVLIQGVTLKNPQMFTLVPRDCDDVTIDSVTFISPDEAPNTDGIDPSGHNYLITRCTFDTGDDCIAFKPQRARKDGTISCDNITVSDCTFKHGHGLSIGGQTPAGMRNLTVRDCTFENTDAGIRMKAPRGEGGLVENLTYENITMTNVKVAIFITSYYPNSSTPKEPDKDKPQPVTEKTPIWRNIHITNVTAEGGEEAGRIFGLPEAPIENLVLTNVNLSAQKGLNIANAKGVEFKDCQIKAAEGEPLIARNAETLGLSKTE